MSDYKILFVGDEALENELIRLNHVRFDGVKTKSLVQMLNRARRKGGTPQDTRELLGSSSTTQNEMGYTKEYAAHVEYGHRTKNGGYIEGQRFLKKNVDTQREIYIDDLKKSLKKG